MDDAPDNEVSALAVQNARKHRFITFLTILLFPLVLTLWVDKADPDKVGSFLFWAVIVTIGVIQVLAFALDKPVEDIAPTIFLTVREQRQIIEALNARDEALSAEVQAMTSAFVLGKSWSAIQSHLPVFFGRKDADLREACERIAEPLRSSLADIFGMGFNDKWSVVVYRWDGEAGLLRPVYWDRARDHPSEQSEPRSWRDGEGHSGTAFMAEKVLFTSDVAQPSTLNRVYPRPENVRSYDLDIYRSFVTVPLIVTDADDLRHRLGVVALTSDHVGRFDETNVAVVEELGEVLGEALWLAGVRDQAPKPISREEG